jgi:hypothetical protein
VVIERWRERYQGHPIKHAPAGPLEPAE